MDEFTAGARLIFGGLSLRLIVGVWSSCRVCLGWVQHWFKVGVGLVPGEGGCGLALGGFWFAEGSFNVI